MQPALTLTLIVSLQQKAVIQFTNVCNYLSKSGPIPFKCPFTELKNKGKVLIVSACGRSRKCLLMGISKYRVSMGVQTGFCEGGRKQNCPLTRVFFESDFALKTHPRRISRKAAK